MDISIIVESKLFIAVISALLGSLLTIVTKLFLNKRGIFSYYVYHTRIAQSSEDIIYGSVRVTWNDSPISNLYISAVELINSSLKDYESVIVRIYTNNTILLTQKTYIVGTTRSIDFTEDYKNKIAIKEGNNKPTKDQLKLFRSQRDYFVPTMNRGQILRFEFLNSALPDQQPTIWVDVLHKGIKCKFRIAKNMVFGIPQNEAAITGTIVGLFAVILIIIFIKSIPISAILSFIIGLIVIIPGAYVVKILRKIRDVLAG
jgi:hypothetical protein